MIIRFFQGVGSCSEDVGGYPESEGNALTLIRTIIRVLPAPSCILASIEIEHQLKIAYFCPDTLWAAHIVDSLLCR